MRTRNLSGNSSRPAALTALAALAALQGCGGGGGGGHGSAGVSTSSLSLPDQVSIITPSGDPNATALDVSSFAPDSDYATDLQRIHVYDPAIDPIRTVNGILCLIGQTGYRDCVNSGDYIAQIDEEACDMGDDPGNSGQVSSTGPNLNSWVVHSERADANSPLYVKLWVPEEDQGVDSTIRVKLAITQGVSASNPFGVFGLNFAGVPDVNGDVNNPAMFGTLSTYGAAAGQLGFQFFQHEGDVDSLPPVNDEARETSATVTMAPDRTTGEARIHLRSRRNDSFTGDSGIVTQDYLIAFDAAHLLRQLGNGAPATFSRDQFVDHVYRYDLYHCSGPNAGQRVALNAGFPFRTSGGDFGYVGYYGMWAPPDVTIDDGDSIDRTNSDGSTTPFTVKVGEGKLYRYTRGDLPLANSGGISFDWFAPGNGPMQQLRLVYDQVDARFEAIASYDAASNTWNDLTPSVPVNDALYPFLNLYSRQLGGPCFFHHGDSSITYFEQSLVQPDDDAVVGQLDLYGYYGCLDAGVTASDVTSGSIYLPPSNNVAQPYHFRFDPAAYDLGFDVNGDGSSYLHSGLAGGESLDGTPMFWGLRSGPMVPDVSGFASTGDLFAADLFYVWESGSNPWNLFAGVSDADGDFVHFDQPIQFLYTHSTANDRNADPTHDGESVFLNYDGQGQLNGINYEPVDVDGDGNPDRWFPSFSIGDGVMVGPTGSEYVLKAIDIEQQLEIDPAGPGSLTLTGAAALTLPDATDYVTPDNGPMPTVTDPPKVVAGEVQGGS